MEVPPSLWSLSPRWSPHTRFVSQYLVRLSLAATYAHQPLPFVCSLQNGPGGAFKHPISHTESTKLCTAMLAGAPQPMNPLHASAGGCFHTAPPKTKTDRAKCEFPGAFQLDV